MPSFLADTNLLLRLSDSGAALHSTASQALAALFARGDEVFITAQNLVEFWAVATRPRDANGFGWDTQRTQREVEDIRQRFAFLPESGRIFEIWLQVVASSCVSGKRAHDARLVAVMVAHSVDRILTFNTADFSGFVGIIAVDPRTCLTGAEPKARAG
jgi:predicted nucleic acid-binding protein